jgi:hypothetical protein
MDICRCLDAKTSFKNKEGKLLTNQTTVIVDITITTKWAQAAEQLELPLQRAHARIYYQFSVKTKQWHR